MIGFVIGRRFKSIDRVLNVRLWWFGKWAPVKLEMGPMEVYWSREVEGDIVAQLEQ